LAASAEAAAISSGANGNTGYTGATGPTENTGPTGCRGPLNYYFTENLFIGQSTVKKSIGAIAGQISQGYEGVQAGQVSEGNNGVAIVALSGYH
jgi:hypothetical protein